MHGFSDKLPLAPFVGVDLNQICLGPSDLQLIFSGAGSMSIWSPWQLQDPAGLTIDEAQNNGERDAFRIHKLLALPLASFEIDAPGSLTLIFEPAFRFTIFDDTPMYEAMRIYIDGDPTMYIV